MTWLRRFGWLLAGVVATLALQALIILSMRIDVATRPKPVPPEGVEIPYPWGAIDLDELQTLPDSGLQTSLAESFAQESAAEFDRDGDGVRRYALLALSGGGSNGAFGAGLLNGWTKSGTRPDFKVVTGVSTGSLQATFAFLGPEYDDELKEIYLANDTDDVHVGRGLLAGLFNDAIRDTTPLAGLIRRYVDEELLAAVAAKHEQGHRLFVGTTNMDTGEFVIWDLGQIASSGRPHALELYRKVLLASSSVPVLFPPVYFEIESDGAGYYEMHADGGTYAQVFFRGFLLDFDDAIDDAGIDESRIVVQLYAIRNGTMTERRVRDNVEPRALSIASATINSLFCITMETALYRMYVLAHRYKIDFALAYIPGDVSLDLDPRVFDPEGMRHLYDFGYRLAAHGYEWHRHPPGLDPDELFDEP